MTEIVKYQNALTKYQPTTLDDICKLADLFAASGLFNADNARQSAAQLVVKILAGQELGLTPFTAANGMQIIKGKCAPGANLMAAMVKASGRYSYRVTEITDVKVSIDFHENGKLIGTSTFTATDAKNAGTQHMGKFSRNMLFARAISNGVKWYCPDLANGVAMYTPEELGATVDYETGEIIEQSVEPTIAQHRQLAEPPPTDAELDSASPMLFDDQAQAKSPAFKRFQAEGSKTFGRDWDNARHWLIERYTRKMTPDQVRRSGNDLSDDECDVLADTLAERRGYYQSEWKRAAPVAVAA